jgi:hypothetical protein
MSKERRGAGLYVVFVYLWYSSYELFSGLSAYFTSIFCSADKYRITVNVRLVPVDDRILNSLDFSIIYTAAAGSGTHAADSNIKTIHSTYK